MKYIQIGQMAYLEFCVKRERMVFFMEKKMSVKDLLTSAMENQYQYNGSRLVSPYNNKVYVAGISKMASNGKLYTPLRLLDQDFNTISDNVSWVDNQSFYGTNYKVLSKFCEVSLFEKKYENNAYHTIMTVLCHDTSVVIQYNLTKLTIYLYCILKQYEKDPYITPDKVKFDLFDIDDMKYCTDYSLSNNKLLYSYNNYFGGFDDYIETYKENIYDDYAYSYSLNEILKKWWGIYETTELKNLKYMYNKYNVDKLFDSVSDDVLATELYFIFINSFKVLCHDRDTFTYGSNNYTSLYFRSGYSLNFLDFEEYMSTDLGYKKIYENYEKFLKYRSISSLASQLRKLYKYKNDNNLTNKNYEKLVEVLSAINEILEGHSLSYYKPYLLANRIKSDPFFSDKLSAENASIKFEVEYINGEVANHIYKSNSPIPYNLIKNEYMMVIYLDYKTPILCGLNINSIIEMENTYNNCNNMIDVLQTAIDNKVIDKDELNSMLKNMLQVI